MEGISEEDLLALDTFISEEQEADFEIDNRARASLASQEHDSPPRKSELEDISNKPVTIPEDKYEDWQDQSKALSQSMHCDSYHHGSKYDSHAEETDTHSVSYLSEGYESPLTPTHGKKSETEEDTSPSTSDRGHKIEFDRELHEALSTGCSKTEMVFFDSYLGRGAFIDELAKSFIDGSSSKSLAWYRMASYGRASEVDTKIREGWLLKRGPYVPTWHKRWFMLHQTSKGPRLSYARDSVEKSTTKNIALSSTSRCIVVDNSKQAKENEFKIITYADSEVHEYLMSAPSAYEMNEWVYALQASMNAGTRSVFEGTTGFEELWNDLGVKGFVLRYGIRKLNRANHMRTRVLELNFAEKVIADLRRGEAINTVSFNELRAVTIHSSRGRDQEYGLLLSIKGLSRPWPIFLDTIEARDDLFSLLCKITRREIGASDLKSRYPRLLLRKAVLERKHIDTRRVTSRTSIRGRLQVVLHEGCIALYPEHWDSDSPPWYVLRLIGLQISCREEKCLIVFGRFGFVCCNPTECRQWCDAARAAISLPKEVIRSELQARVLIKNEFHSTVARLRRLLKANVKPEVNGPPKDSQTINMMIKTLWSAVYPGEMTISNTDERWQEVGFQRGGPASDLRSSGLLGLHCFIYFVKSHDTDFRRVFERTRFGVSLGNMKNYPLAVACINVVSVLTETLGFGDGGSHLHESSINALKTFFQLIAAAIDSSREVKEETTLRPLSSFSNWEDIKADSTNHVFEEMFCILFPILDALFVEMGAGYMEFGHVIGAFRRRLDVIFGALPASMKQLRVLAKAPCTDILILPEMTR
uniref:Uncharacterized protein AlNc14C274G10005 n=1 Tax=Albugo laibachii Nc14 TaxID=890382 RepID=F0WUJ4_9STRA|nr:conserved hypothetical protein [Albugo laibachii Nc14]|eukprot:CCA25075.1 conserved hypothetical protein [Albugo laibachii Nc14]